MTWTHLCVDDLLTPYCALANGNGNQILMQLPASYTTNWTYPNIDGTTGAIKQANVNLCMQLDHADGDIVRGAPCVGDFAEYWVNAYDHLSHRTMFFSDWYLKYTKLQMCLAWNGVGLEVEPCSLGSNQLFGTS